MGSSNPRCNETDNPMTDPTTDDVAELRVAARTPTAELASAISHAVYDGGKVRLRAVGAGAVNQAVKAIAVAQGFTAQRGLNLVNRPGLLTITMDGQERTAVVFHIFTV